MPYLTHTYSGPAWPMDELGLIASHTERISGAFHIEPIIERFRPPSKWMILRNGENPEKAWLVAPSDAATMGSITGDDPQAHPALRPCPKCGAKMD